MAYQTFFGASTNALRVEVDDTDGTTSSAYAPSLFAGIREMASFTADQLAKLPPDARPSELEIAYLLKALPTGGFGIPQRNESANFTVRMRWSSIPMPEVPTAGGEHPPPTLPS